MSSKLTLAAAAMLSLAACQCGGPSLVHTYDNTHGTDGGAKGGGTGTSTGGGTGGGSGGAATGGASGGGTGGAATGGGTGGAAAGWCASDCDCPTGTRCVSGTGELATNSCEPGTNACTQSCGGGCATGQQCQGGVCTVAPCLGASCPPLTFSISVAGTYFTYYEFDVHDFAQKASDILKLIDLLTAALNGTATCSAGTSPADQLMCVIVQMIAQHVHPPAWITQLLTVLSDAFKFGNDPIKVKGVMQLAENSNGTLYGAEVWKEMWMNYNGQVMNVMNNPALGANGNITVTVKAFGGTRNATDVFLGPRSIEFDVNKLLVNLFNVIITAATGGQAHDVGGLLQLALCANLPQTSSTYLTCVSAAQAFAQNFQLDSGLGGIDLTQQRATIYDLNNDGVADALGLPSARGSVTGTMSNGFVTGTLGPFPKSNWYGTK